MRHADTQTADDGRDAMLGLPELPGCKRRL